MIDFLHFVCKQSLSFFFFLDLIVKNSNNNNSPLYKYDIFHVLFVFVDDYNAWKRKHVVFWNELFVLSNSRPVPLPCWRVFARLHTNYWSINTEHNKNLYNQSVGPLVTNRTAAFTTITANIYFLSNFPLTICEKCHFRVETQKWEGLFVVNTC